MRQRIKVLQKILSDEKIDELYAKLEIPERGGVGIENTLLITKEGARSLTNAPLELIIV